MVRFLIVIAFLVGPISGFLALRGARAARNNEIALAALYGVAIGVWWSDLLAFGARTTTLIFQLL